MANLNQRLSRLEQRRKPDAEFEHVRTEEWVIIARAGKAIIALPDNGRDQHA
ncbi:hypothetical protein [Sphingobium yanoikuyae]|uniref:hypothetical protein n=1 Tax=Sphingobium yanoikuyae TaxID=13690 RepID=UPI0028AE3A82|nr:hypothetical protein [Sphingobium yanoikuyae]